MARYIDADAFEQRLADKDIFFPALFKNELDEMTTADVTPKSEVERLENTYRRAIRKIDNKTITAIRNARQDAAREIFAEIDKIIQDSQCEDCLGKWHEEGILFGGIAELEKKYTEVQE